MPFPKPLPVRAAVASVLAAGAVLLAALPAAAHVTVQPSSVAADATDQTFAFRVPNEQDGASTTKVEIDLPSDTPIPSALVAPVPGWTDQIQTAKLATPIHTDDGDITEVVSQIVWTGGQIAPGHYQDFTVDFGALPTGTDKVVFKALQTYSDGSVVRWIDVPKDGQPEPQHPAPVLHLTAAADSAASKAPSAAASAAGASAPAAAAAVPVAVAKDDADSDGTARVLGVVGIAVGALGVASGVLIGRRRGTGSAD
ncbi:YcnI family protein [Kitasatospora sp. NPDC006697]|uniref:YcnI family copper-binding membrane protein n=1 Tax=Kitasatospora sp. NPDC006697 TaxID=3364020 RepID=UPI0036804B2C